MVEDLLNGRSVELFDRWGVPGEGKRRQLMRVPERLLHGQRFTGSI
jgi:hypothetical protein